MKKKEQYIPHESGVFITITMGKVNVTGQEGMTLFRFSERDHTVRNSSVHPLSLLSEVGRDI